MEHGSLEDSDANAAMWKDLKYDNTQFRVWLRNCFRSSKKEKLFWKTFGIEDCRSWANSLAKQYALERRVSKRTNIIDHPLVSFFESDQRMVDALNKAEFAHRQEPIFRHAALLAIRRAQAGRKQNSRKVSSGKASPTLTPVPDPAHLPNIGTKTVSIPSSDSDDQTLVPQGGLEAAESGGMELPPELTAGPIISLTVPVSPEDGAAFEVPELCPFKEFITTQGKAEWKHIKPKLIQTAIARRFPITCTEDTKDGKREFNCKKWQVRFDTRVLATFSPNWQRVDENLRHKIATRMQYQANLFEALRAIMEKLEWDGPRLIPFVARPAAWNSTHAY